MSAPSPSMMSRVRAFTPPPPEEQQLLLFKLVLDDAAAAYISADNGALDAQWNASPTLQTASSKQHVTEQAHNGACRPG